MKEIHFKTRAQGKLLLTGEYFVLDGAQALAVPVRFGQSLEVAPGHTPGRLDWASLEPDGTPWFEASFELPALRIKTSTDLKTALTLFKILHACQAQRPDILGADTALQVSTQTDFPREWGLGTSSTLIAALARWGKLDAYKILFDTLGGSGYDLACAYAEGPILYSLEDKVPQVRPVSFAPAFSEQLYFVYLGKKQNSRDGIAQYRERVSGHPVLLEKITALTQQFLSAQTRSDFDAAIQAHEHLISEALVRPRAKELYFSDFWGEIKSLGAWGGDFVLVSSARPEAETRAYFLEKGLDVFLTWREMV